MVIVVAKAVFTFAFAALLNTSLIQSLSFIHSHHYLEVQSLIYILLTYFLEKRFSLVTAFEIPSLLPNNSKAPPSLCEAF